MIKNSFIQNLLFQWQVKVICLVLAISVYFLVSFSSYSDREVLIPLDVILPNEYIAESLVPQTIDLVIEGNENIIYLIDPSLVRAKVDFSNVSKEGIVSAPVLLEYEEKVFEKGDIVLNTKPTSVRISFKKRQNVE